jgi:hypothetical protein
MGFGVGQVDGYECPGLVGVLVLHDPTGKGDALDFGESGRVVGGDESLKP